MTEVEKYLPDYYVKSRYMQGLCHANDKEFDRLYAKIEQFDRNMSVDTADADSIKKREKSLGISVTDDPLDVRRNRIKARMRGALPTTVKNLETAVRAFDDSATVTEHISDYSFELNLRRADILNEATELVENIKPAHLAAHYRIMPDMPKSTMRFVSGIKISGSSALRFGIKSHTHTATEQICIYGTAIYVKGHIKIPLKT